MARVSILLPSLNAREFLEARVESLRNQAFREWEGIVLDSGSTDGTWEYFQSAAAKDSRFRLNQIPREGLYGALNRGLELATGEFVHIATCDDSMSPNFLVAMLAAFSQFTKAGIVTCDLQFINRDGDDLSREDLRAHFSSRGARNLLRLDHVRTAFADEQLHQINYRPVPHDSLLHFDGRSVYFSLNQLVVRTSVARATGRFQTNIGSVADFDWLLRLTSNVATVHIPRKLAIWRFHGNQLSLKRDESRASARREAAERSLLEIREKFPNLLTENDCEAVLLPLKVAESKSNFSRVLGWFRSFLLLSRLFVRRPATTFRALARTRFRFGTRHHTLLPMVFEAHALKPETLTAESGNQST